MKFRVFLFVLFVVACAPLPGNPASPDTAVTSPPEDDMPTNEPAVNPLSPKPGDKTLIRGNLFINEASLVIRESDPPQISLSIGGDLPTPCHQLRLEISSPGQENKIVIEAYSVVDPNMMCTQVIKSFQEYIDLGTFPDGHYSVWVNGELAGEFDS